MLLQVEFQFNAAHRLPFQNGPCSHTHGHNYQLLVLVEGQPDSGSGTAVDFESVKRVVRQTVLPVIDHNDLNQVLENPTAENLVSWVWDRLEPALPGLVELRLFETADCAVIYRGKEHAQATAPPP